MDWQKHIRIDSQICKGRPCIKGTRIMVSVILDNLADGVSNQDIIQGYPPITEQNIQACIAFAADLARDETIDIQHVVEV